MERNWDLQLRRAKIIYRLIMGVLRPTRFPLPDHDNDDTSKHCKDCLVTRLHRPYMALPLWFSQNHVTEMDDLRETIFGSSAYKGGSSSSLHRLSTSRSSAVGVSYIRKDHLPDWTQIKSHNNTKLNRMEQHRFHYLRRACRDSFIIYLWHGNEQPKICISTSSRGNLVHLRRARCTCKNACTEFRSSRFPLLYEGFHSKIKFTIVFIPVYCLLKIYFHWLKIFSCQSADRRDLRVLVASNVL